MTWVLSAGFGVATAVLTAWLAASRTRRQTAVKVSSARKQAEALKRAAERESAAAKRKAETEGRAFSLERRAEVEQAVADREAELAIAEEKLYDVEEDVQDYRSEVFERDREFTSRHEAVVALRKSVKGLKEERNEIVERFRESLEERAGVDASKVLSHLSTRFLEQASAQAAHRVRAVEMQAQQTQDSATTREAQRIINIAVSRYRNHFLTERLISKIPVNKRIFGRLADDASQLHGSIEEVAGVQLQLAETEDFVRLDGLDGVGREIARRALNRLQKRPRAMAQAEEDPKAWVEKIRRGLEQEIDNLGRRAFKVLGVKKADDEIVDLVGRLNWRTSYTQNQWLHAVEASFLAGMMAREMNLDVKIARRATLMHDIGKALTHKIDGSHAVIGADIARRLGEDELVCNAIGAHHLDEPMNSVYAYLVAAADALSGARPGARREQTEGYANRLQDLERIGRRYRGVDRCYAVHGGRELRVYVREGAISDLEAVELSDQIAEQISDEMVFPGQIKVTVIRALEAVATAS